LTGIVSFGALVRPYIMAGIHDEGSSLITSWPGQKKRPENFKTHNTLQGPHFFIIILLLYWGYNVTFTKEHIIFLS
jgi:hypothetical protein